MWIKSYIKEYGGEPDTSGVEAIVYLGNDGKNVFKINNGVHHPNWLDFFIRLVAHNTYFPETKYVLIGFTCRDGKLAVVLKQPLIEIERGANPNEIKLDLERLGFKFISKNEVVDEYNGVILRDLHIENAVISKNGYVFYIDPLIQFTSDSKFYKKYC